MAFLEIQDLTKRFGGLMAVDGLSMEIEKREIVGLIGPNGAGKTTAFNLISGMLPVTAGSVFFNGDDVTTLKVYQNAEKGLVRSFQLPTLFSSFTVLDNLLMGMHLHSGVSVWSSVFQAGSTQRREQELTEKACEIMKEVGLYERREEIADNLPHGYKRVLQLAISLGCEPGLLLLDEPVTGMNSEEVQLMMSLIRKLNESRGITFVIVEHNIRAVMGICQRIVVLNFGKKIAEGTPDEISKNQAVIEAYLGVHDDVA